MVSKNLPKILCVDDETHVLSGLKRRMRTRYNITTALGAEEGLQELENNGPFDVVISDYKMPGMNGAEFLRKAYKLDPAATRILLTGEANMQEVQAAINDGHVYKVLLKPCSAEELREAMSSAVKKHAEKASANVQIDELLKTLTP